MRILVISDSHGRNDDIEGVLKQVGDIDMMIHCGDVERGDSYIREIADCPVVMVAGNNDYYLDLPSEEEVRIGDYKVLQHHIHIPKHVLLNNPHLSLHNSGLPSSYGRRQQ